MKHHVLLCLFALSFASSWMQAEEGIDDTTFVYFNRIYQADTANILSHCVLPIDSSGYLVAGIFGAADSYQALYLRYIDLLGETVWVKILDDDPDFIKTLDRGAQLVRNPLTGDIALCYTRNDPNLEVDSADIRLLIMNADGEVHSTYDYATPINDFVRVMTTCPDGDYVLGAMQKDGFMPDDLLLIRLNSEGEELWAKTYSNQDGHRLAIQSVEALDNGGFVVGGSIVYSGGGADMIALKVSDDGEQQWLRVLEFPESDNGSALYNIHSDTILLTGGIRIDDVEHAFFAKLDTLGDTTWEKTVYLTYEYATPYKIISTGYGYISIGFHQKETLNYSTLLVGYSKDFEVLWQHDISPDPLANIFIRDLEKTYDDGYIICGMQGSSAPQYSWLAKIDSLGNCCSLDSPCDSLVIDSTCVSVPIVLPQLESRLVVYPNPVDQVLHVKYALPGYGQAAWLRIFNDKGMEVRSKRLFADATFADIEFNRHLESGIYVYTLEIADEIHHRGKFLKQ